MSGDFPYSSKIVSPIKCNEKPWDLWVSEIGHTSPIRDEDAVSTIVTATNPAAKGSAPERRISENHPYKIQDRGHSRYRRQGLNRLKYDTMSLHGLFPQMDNLNTAVCHMCGVTVRCSAVYRHLLESHSAGAEPILPPPPPAPTVKLKSLHSRSRHKKDLVQPQPSVEVLPVSVDAQAQLPRIVIPQKEMQYLTDDASTSSALTGEVQVCMETGELPVVSIQDTDDLPLGENITDDIFAIMNSEGIQSADDITNVADWKNIIRDIGNLQDINFSQTTDSLQQTELYAPVDTVSLPAFGVSDDLSNIQLTSCSSPMLPNVIETNVLNAQTVKPVATVSHKVQSKQKSSKSKLHNVREYDPNKHCGVVTVDNPKPCTRSLTCKAHALSLRRTVEGRSKLFDTLLAEHRASRDASIAAASLTTASPVLAVTVPPAASPVSLTIPPSLLVNTSIDLSAFNNLNAEQQVNDIYASLLSAEDPNSVLPDTSSITSLLSQPLTADQFLLPDDAELGAEVPLLSIASPVETVSIANLVPMQVEECVTDENPPTIVPSDVYWYSSCPRPLSVCTFNTSHAGGAITLGKKFATVRSNIKSSLMRSQGKASVSGINNYYNFSQNSLSSLSKTVHINNASKSNKPEVRKLVVTCSGTREQTFSDLGGYVSGELRHTINGHLACGRRDEDDKRKQRPGMKSTKHSTTSSMLDLGFMLDPLMADEKC